MHIDNNFILVYNKNMKELFYTKINKDMGYKQDIDLSIVSIIELLNKNGLKTKASCSGIKYDHIRKNNKYVDKILNSWKKLGWNNLSYSNIINLNEGYISFYNKLDSDFKKNIYNFGFEIEDDRIIRIFGNTKNLRKCWNKLYKYLRRKYE